MYIKILQVSLLAPMQIPLYATDPCIVENLGGTQPDKICQMREFLKSYDSQAHQFPGKNALLIYGPLGTGKTLVAQAIAQESQAQVLYFKLGTDKFLERAWIGLKIKEVYDEAERLAKENKKPVVVIWDEIDQICGKDSTKFSLQEKEALVELCKQIKAHAHCSYLVTILATAYSYTVNGELRDCTISVEIGIPNYDNRLAIIRFYARRQKIELSEKFCRELANNYSDFSGRFIEVAFNTARTFAAIDDEPLNESYIRAAFDRKRRMHDPDGSSFYTVWRALCEMFGAT